MSNVNLPDERLLICRSANFLYLLQGCFLTLILSTVEHLVLILLEFLEFLVEFFQNSLEFLFKIA